MLEGWTHHCLFPVVQLVHSWHSPAQAAPPKHPRKSLPWPKKNTVVHSFTCSTYPNVPHRTLSSKLWVEHLKYFCNWVWLGTWRCFRIQADQTGELFIARLENKSRQHLLHLTKQSLLPSLFIFLETAIASLQAGPTAAARVEDETWKLNQETPAHICLLLSK